KHPRLPLMNHIVDRRNPGEHRSTVAERDPAIGPLITPIDMESLVDADYQRDPHQRILCQLLIIRFGFPCVECRRCDTAKQSARLWLREFPLPSDFYKGFDRTGA